MRTAGALLAVLVALIVPAVARGSTLLATPSLLGQPPTWSLTSDSGNNTITVTVTGTQVTVEDAGESIVITLGPGVMCAGNLCGCTGNASSTVVCPRFRTLFVQAGGGNDTVTATAPTDYGLSLLGESGVDTLSGGSGNDTIDGGSGNDAQLAGQAGNDTLIGGSGADQGISGGAGIDVFSYDDGRTGGVTATVRGSNSDGDQLASSTSIETLRGSNRADVLTGSGGPDTLVGSGGDDILVGGLGSDALSGGDGRDLAGYADGRSDGITATLGGANSDGDVYDSIEGLTGGPGPDTLTGDDSANVLEGGPGQDLLRGGAGNDIINALDGGPDSLDCGDGADTATVDPADSALACETLRHIDADGDGFDTTADCNDANPAVNPGAAEILDNGVDDNCDGTSGTTPVTVPSAPADGDGDGFNSLLDCNDASAAIRPGAREIPGNKVDENCDGLRPDFPLTGASITIFLFVTKTSARITELTLNAVPARSRAEIRCHRPRKRPKACPFTTVRRTFAKAHRKVGLTSVFKRRKLPVGTEIEVRVIVPGAIGKVRSERIVPRNSKRTLSCIRPGANKPSRCPVT